METLKIGVIGTNTYPIPPRGYGGEIFIHDLVVALSQMGHQVDLYATPLSRKPPNGELYYMRSSYGSHIPWFFECEQEAYDRYHDKLLKYDVVSDQSHTKRIAENLHNFDGRTNCVSTLIGSTFSHPKPPYNIVVWSEAHRQMGIKGMSGYEGSGFPGESSGKIKNARVAKGGTDTDWFYFQSEPDDYYLFFSRLHPSKGYDIAIQLAKEIGFPLVIMGDHPKDAPTADHRFYGWQVLQLIQGYRNIKFIALPRGDTHFEERNELKRRVLQKAKALIHPVRYHPCWDLVVTEAMSCGVPTVTFDRGAMPEQIINGVNGFAVQYPSIPHFKKAIEAAETIARKDCRRIAVEKFSRERMAERYLELYKQVIDGEVWGL